MSARLYECHVMHHRFSPRRHRFFYRIFMVGLDLAEPPRLPRRSRLFAINGRGLYSIREDDYLPVGEPVHNPSSRAAQIGRRSSLRSRVVAFLAAHGITYPEGRIELITMPRVLGYHFNPVSFYVCRDPADRPVAAIAEVTNTFREIKPFCLGRPAEEDGTFHIRVPKHFYVSPYSDVDVEFDITLRARGNRLSVKIDDFAARDRILTSTVAGESQPLRDLTLAWFLIKYPVLTLRVMGLIHWHALQLWRKRVPWFRKAARAADQRDLYRPDPSVLSPHHSK